jgi:hypothetical protein
MTGTPQFKFTFYNTLYPIGVIVPAPLGWQNASISLERHKEYHSLVEYFKGSFLWYGLARQVIREVEDDQGPEAELRCLIEVTYGAGFETVFDGLIDISQQEDIAKAGSFYKQQAPIIRDDFWAKFINRKSTPVDLEATVDLDGNARTPVSKIVLPLPSQMLRQRNYRLLDFGEAGMVGLGVVPALNAGYLVQIGTDTVEIDELKTVSNLGTGINTGQPIYTYQADYSGEHSIKISLEVSILQSIANYPLDEYRILSIGEGIGEIEFRYRVNGEIPIPLSGNFIKTDNDGSAYLPLPESGGFPLRWRVSITEFNSSTFEIELSSINLNKGDEVSFYGDIISSFAASGDVGGTIETLIVWGRNRSLFVRWFESSVTNQLTIIHFDEFTFPNIPSGENIPTYIDLTGNTIFDETETDAYLIKDAAESILSKIVGRDSVVKSDVLTNTCKRLRAIMRGKHVRGYNMSGNSNPDLNKEFFMKFDEWFEGANPLLFLGLGYTEVGGNPKIEIEPISDFYDPDFTVTFDNVSDLVRTYDQDKIFKAIEIGFQKWSSESDSGIDDPQTKRNYRTKFATIGQELKILCKWLAASLAIERSRRNRVELGKDDRNDEEIISICLTEYEAGYTPEFSENFDSVTNLLNPDFRYNIRDSVARIVKRWQPFLQGCLQHTTGEKIYFASGEGNYSMQSLLSSGDCEVSPEDVDYGLAEDQDIDVTTDFIFIPKLYKCKVPMSWAKYKTIVATRKKAIGISRTTENHVAAFIMELDYKLVGGYAEMLVLLGENTDV